MPENTSITIEEGTLGIADYAFYICWNMTSVTIPSSVISIGGSAFGWCTGLTSVIIPNSVVSIDDYAFFGCSGLISVAIGVSVTSIGKDAFFSCKRLTDLYCYAKGVPATGADVFYEVNTNDATLHVLAASLEEYKATAPWSEFGNIVPLTDEELTGVDELTIDNKQLDVPEGIYDLNGRRLAKMQKGINIVRMSDGKVKKVLIK